MASNDSELPVDRAAPVIGISCYMEQADWGVWDAEAALIPADYVRMVTGCGAVPVLLPPHGQTPEVCDRLDGLLLAGGADVGAQPHRDATEILLLAAARERGLPVLGICRGLQIITVAAGGSLIEHVPDVIGHSDYQPSPGVYGTVEVETTPGSLAEAILSEKATAPCYHHQAALHLGEGFTVTARSPEGLIEAIEPVDAGSDEAEPDDTGPGWLFAVQWHPEHNPDDDRVVAALVEAARTRMRARTRETAETRSAQ